MSKVKIVKILEDEGKRVTYNPTYSDATVEELSKGYGCSCGGDEHDEFDESENCECYCHQPDEDEKKGGN